MAISVTASPINVGVEQRGGSIGITQVATPIEIGAEVDGVKVLAVTGPIDIDFRFLPAVLTRTAGNRDPAKDTVFDCSATDVHGNDAAGTPVITVGIEGDWLNVTIFPSAISVTAAPDGSFIEGGIWGQNTIDIVFGIAGLGPMANKSSNLVAWSKIGRFDFEVDRTNSAGNEPMDWHGWVNDILKLGNKVVVYGEGGVTFLTPAKNAWGLNTLYRVGIKNKGAVAGNDFVHYFVDSDSQLWEVTQDGLKFLNYQEYLSTLGYTVLSWDEKNAFLYICDGIDGYVYSARDGSLGRGPSSITGIGYRDGTRLVVESWT